MPIRLRLAMHGTRHRKIFHLVAINHTLRRDAKPAELLGIYNPHDRDTDNTRLVRWSVTRIHHWLSVGARPSKSVVKLLELVRALLLVIVLSVADLEQGGILKPDSPYHSKATQPKHRIVELEKPNALSTPTKS